MELKITQYAQRHGDIITVLKENPLTKQLDFNCIYQISAAELLKKCIYSQMTTQELIAISKIVKDILSARGQNE